MRTLSKLANVILGPTGPPPRPSMPVEKNKVTSKEPPVIANVIQTPIKVLTVSNLLETLASLLSDLHDVTNISDT